MTQKLSFSTYALIGTLLFGMFFGAGNLIFPILLGQLSGTNFWFGLGGFLVTAIGLPFIGILAMGISGSNSLRDLASRVNPMFGLVFSLVLYLTIGPFFAIPRTATVSFTVGIESHVSAAQLPLFLGIFSLIFFLIVYYFSLNPAKIMDYIGKYLTPAFLLFLFILIITSFIFPMGSFQQPSGEYIDQAFMTGFKEGYNTMDALASLAFGIVVINAIKSKGVTSASGIAKAAIKSGIFAMALMMIIYAFITYMGATSVEAVGRFDNGGLIFAAVANHLFGPYGGILLAVIIILACLKTSIGLITACSEFFHEVFPKISYKWFVLILCIVSFGIANFGLTNIIKYAVPVLVFLYPLAIVLILLTLCSKLFGGRQDVFKGAIFLTFFVSIVDAYNALIKDVPQVKNAFLDSVLEAYNSWLPLYTIGLGWIVPAVIGGIIGFVISLARKK